MPTVNSKPTKCAHCGETVPAGLGRFIGKDVVVHNDARCLRGSRAPFSTQVYERPRITQQLARAAKALFSP